MCKVWLAQGEKPREAHVQSTFQAYMRELEFRIADDYFEDANNIDKHGGAEPLYIDSNENGSYNRFQEVITDLALLLLWPGVQ